MNIGSSQENVKCSYLQGYVWETIEIPSERCVQTMKIGSGEGSSAKENYGRVTKRGSWMKRVDIYNI